MARSLIRTGHRNFKSSPCLNGWENMQPHPSPTAGAMSSTEPKGELYLMAYIRDDRPLPIYQNPPRSPAPVDVQPAPPRDTPIKTLERIVMDLAAIKSLI